MVVILAVLAGAVVSQFGTATADAKDATLRQNLQAIRKQWELFKVQHNGHPPGWTDLTDMGGHLFAYTNAAGDISTTPSPNHPYGPYWYGPTTINPWNGATGAKLVLDPTAQTPDHDLMDGDERVGWFLNPYTGQLAPNAEGTTSDGTPRIQL